MDDSQRLEVFIERFSNNIGQLLNSMQELKASNEKLVNELNQLDKKFVGLNIEKRFENLEEWKQQVTEIWNVDGMMQTKLKTENNEKFTIRVATIYGVIMTLLSFSSLLLHLLKK